jgi:hypothetical protein
MGWYEICLRMKIFFFSYNGLDGVSFKDTLNVWNFKSVQISPLADFVPTEYER